MSTKHVVETYTGIHLRTNVYRYALTYIRIFYRAFNIVHMCVGVGVSISISLSLVNEVVNTGAAEKCACKKRS